MKGLILGFALLAFPALAVETKTAINVAGVSTTAITSGSAVVSDFTSTNAPTTTFRFVCNVDTYVELTAAQDTTPTGYISASTWVPAYVPEYFEMLERRKVSLRAMSASGSCNISKMGKGL